MKYLLRSGFLLVVMFCFILINLKAQSPESPEPETSPSKSDEDYRKIRDQNWFERFHNNYIELLNLEDKSKRISEAEETLRKIEKAIGEDDLLNSERTIELKLKLRSIILGEES